MKSHRLHATGKLCPIIVLLITVMTVLVASDEASAQQTVGLFVNDAGVAPGYTLFSSLGSTETYLIDNNGQVVHSWTSAYPPGNSMYLLENGDLLRAARSTTIGFGGRGGRVEKFDWDGNLIWEYDYFVPDEYLQHHDIEPLPNGNVLILAWEIYTGTEAVANGRDPATLPLSDEVWAERIVEVKPVGSDSGEIVWQWSVWDHLIQDYNSLKANHGVVANHPELVDINFITRPSVGDWIHANSIEYNEDLDQIVLSSRFFSEIWIIDHSTTTAEAAGHTGGNSGMGGDLLYRWGNPQVYRAGDSTDQQLWGQHDAQWIKDGLTGAGNILIFNNGVGGRGYSTVDEITPPLNVDGTYDFPAVGDPFLPVAPAWTYPSTPDPGSFNATFVSGMQRLPNGNTLICDGPAGRMFEVTPAEEIVWDYDNPSDSVGPVEQGVEPFFGSVFRCWKYGPDYAGLAGRDLSPGAPIETYPISIAATQHLPTQPSDTDDVMITTEISSDDMITSAELQVDTGDGFTSWALFDDGLHGDGLAGDGVYGASLPELSVGTMVKYYVSAENSALESAVYPYNPPSAVFRYTVTPASCCIAVRGDVNGDGANADPLDLACLVDQLFGAGCAFSCAEEADVNANGTPSDPVDLAYLVDFLFAGGPAPSNCP